MQNELPVAEVDALRKAGSPGRIESRRLRVLVKIGKLVIRRSSRHKFLVLADKTELTDGRCLAVTEDYKLIDLRKPRQDRMDKFDELIIDEQRRRACMIDRVGDLFRRQADVDRLKHRSHHRDREKGLEKSVAVPVQHSDRVTRSNTDLSQRARQPPDAVPKLAVSQSSEIAVDDLLLRRLHQRSVEQLLDKQGIRIGRRRDGNPPTVHGVLPPVVGRGGERFEPGRTVSVANLYQRTPYAPQSSPRWSLFPLVCGAKARARIVRLNCHSR